jgi:peptidoglycan hydrolase-like protein with peptidoglycan-binding domain
MESADVKKIQRALQTTGDYRGRIDGIPGPMTARAVRSFQERNQSEATGELTILQYFTLVGEP